MSEFKLEERFIVVKLKDLPDVSPSADPALAEKLLRKFLWDWGIQTRECVVVESDWPEYEQVWEMIAARAEERPTPYQVLEQQVAALRQHKTDYMEAAEGTRRALEAEAQALREEVAAYDDGMRALACSLGAGGFNAEKLTAAQLLEKVQWGINNLSETQGRLLDEVRSERDELRARVVVPERLTNADSISRMLREIGYDGDVSYHHAREIWNACLDKLARLNGKAVSEGLLRRLSDLFPADMGDDGSGRA